MTAFKEKALAFLEEGYTCAIVGKNKMLCSKERGVRPLLAWLKSGEECAQSVAADKVVGKAAAYLYVLLSVKEVYAKILSVAAEEVFLRYEIAYAYEEKVPAIRNRKGDGFCPMEQAVWEIDEPQKAYEAILEKTKEL